MVEKELLTLPGASEFAPIFCGVRVARSLVFCVLFCSSLFVLFLLAIALQSSALKVITKLLHDNEATTSLMRFPSIKEGSLWP